MPHPRQESRRLRRKPRAPRDRRHAASAPGQDRWAGPAGLLQARLKSFLESTGEARGPCPQVTPVEHERRRPRASTRYARSSISIEIPCSWARRSEPRDRQPADLQLGSRELQITSLRLPLPSERTQEGLEVRLLLRGEADREPRFVEVHHLREARGEAVVEVWSARAEAAKDGALEAAPVLPLAGDQRLARIGGLVQLPCGKVAQRVQRHVGGAAARVGEAD